MQACTCGCQQTWLGQQAQCTPHRRSPARPAGQTGAGKTHTLSSIKPDAIGMIPRAAAEVFSAIAADPGHEYSVALSYVQIYMELIQVGSVR